MQHRWLISCVVALCAFAARAHADPKSKPGAGKSDASAELTRFAKEMATAFDEVYAHVADSAAHREPIPRTTGSSSASRAGSDR